MKLLKVRLVKKIRRPMSADPSEVLTGRDCDKCRTIVEFGNPMHSVSAKDGYFRSTEYFCADCFEEGKELELVAAVWRRRDEDRIRLTEEMTR